MDERENIGTGFADGAGNGRSGKTSRFEDVKNTVANKLHDAAGALRDKAAAGGTSPETESGFSRYGSQASDWLDDSAEFIRRLDYQQANLKVKEYVRDNPGRSLLMAGITGLLIGAAVRRR